jgi:hypothetical protein
VTKEEVRAKMPELLTALRTVPLSPELKEVRDHLSLLATMTGDAGDPEIEINSLSSPFRFSPVPILGEPLSATILRDRGEY